jgi:hypothetical protein
MSKTFPLLCLLFSAFAFSQTTYKSDYVNINTGDPSWVSFYFGNSITLVGDTELSIQCDFNRAELITNFQSLRETNVLGLFSNHLHRGQSEELHS